MEILDKGKHCEEEFCHQLDLLPMQCKACKKFFCSSHFKYESHKCKHADKFNFVVPQCEICNKPIEFSRDKDLDLCFAEHLQKCLNLQEQMPRSSATNKTTATNNFNKCTYKNCKSKEVFRFECETCMSTYCNRHRLPEIHECNKVIEEKRSKMVKNRMLLGLHNSNNNNISCSRQQQQQQQRQQQTGQSSGYKKFISDYFRK